MFDSDIIFSFIIYRLFNFCQIARPLIACSQSSNGRPGRISYNVRRAFTAWVMEVSMNAMCTRCTDLMATEVEELEFSAFPMDEVECVSNIAMNCMRARRCYGASSRTIP
jgi:hypothetical protein